MIDPKKLIKKTCIIISIMLLIAFVHMIRLGTYFEGKLYIYYYSFFSDIIIPFGVYFLLCLNDATIPILRSWVVKCSLIFIVCASAEMLQYFGFYALGVTFDPLDLVMYAIGVLLAALLEKQVFERFFSCWTVKDNGANP